MTDPGEDSRQPRLAALRAVADEPDEPGPGVLAVGDQRGPGVARARPAEILAYHAHLARGHLLLALTETVLLHGHGRQVEGAGGVEAV